MCNAVDEEGRLPVEGGRVASLLQPVLKQHQQLVSSARPFSHSPDTRSPNATRGTVHREVRSSTPGQETGESEDGGRSKQEVKPVGVNLRMQAFVSPAPPNWRWQEPSQGFSESQVHDNRSCGAARSSR